MDDLRRILRRIDGKGYKAYKDIAGAYHSGDLSLYVDHVQGDPFAAPSKVRCRIPQQRAALPSTLFDNPVRRMALEDFLARQVRRAIGDIVKGGRGTGKSGLVAVDAGGQEVLERTAVVVRPDWVEVRLEVGLPGSGRSILGLQAVEMLCEELPAVAGQGLVWDNLPHEAARCFVECVENQEYLRTQLPEHGLIAFVADGALLPRRSGVSDLPLDAHECVIFRSPDEMRVTLKLLHPLPDDEASGRHITGMGIPAGVTLIVGGGYHGKSTLLQALERGVYPHIPGDGREYVVSCPDAVKIRAEDGRRVTQVDISPFINNLPFSRSTCAFSSERASGSTSQAASLMEALELGATTLLMDEDTSATNFMVRDARMQALVHKSCEPITPFVDRIRQLYADHGISTVLVMGGCGDYFEAADRVVMMREYLPLDVTRKAREIAEEIPSCRANEGVAPLHTTMRRIPHADSFSAARGGHRIKIDTPTLHRIRLGTTDIDLSAMDQLVDASQTRAIAHALHLLRHFMGPEEDLNTLLTRLEACFDEQGLSCLSLYGDEGQHPGNFARPRRYEIAAALNRHRTIRFDIVRPARQRSR
ncbi:MAG TPA: ATPase [Gammaproteobacteria bacterium]|nr:ATPase [Gammaproteobacteria bacterium]